MSFTPIGKPRGLPYPLQSQISNENVTDDAGLSIGDFVWPEDPTERTVLPLWLSQQEFTAIGSAMDVGADIAYPEQYIEVMWLLLRNVRYRVPICNLIIECIENDADTRAAVQQVIADFGDSQYQKLLPLPASVVTAPLPGMGGPIGCDLDILFSQCLTITQMINRLILDTFEQLEVFTNQGEVGAALAQGIPVASLAVEASGVNGLIAYALAIQDAISENYLADYDQQYEEEMACLFFCLGNIDCNISLQEMIDAVGSRITVQINVGSIAELMLSIIDLNITGINVADVYFYFFLNALKLANMFLPRAYGVERLFAVIGSVNDPNDDWKTLCVNCPDEQPGFIVVGNIGNTTVVRSGNTYTISRGYPSGGGGAFLYIETSLGGGASSTSMTFSDLSLSGYTSGYDWGNSSGNFTSVPPSAAPPANVLYAGGGVPPAGINGLQIVITTALPYQGMRQGT